MERRQLEYFLAVADIGSFTAAAKALHVAQPSLSQAVKSLERDVGTPLFHRLPRGVRLTPAGTALLDPARRVVRDLRTARESVREVVGLRGGVLDLAALPGLTLDPLAAVIGAFRREHPDVRLALAQPEDSTTVRDLVRTGQVELGFLDRPPGESEELRVSSLAIQPLRAVFPPGTHVAAEDSVGWAEIVEFGVIAGNRGTIVRDLIDSWCHAEGRPLVRPAVELGRRETALYLVLRGAGVAVFPAALAELAGTLGAVVRPVTGNPARDVVVCQRPGELSPAARTFLATARDHVP